MPFDRVTCAALEHFSTVDPPVTEDAWYGPWNTILTTIFPASQGYMITPQRRIPENGNPNLPEVVFEVVKVSTPPLTFPSRTVLIVKVKSTQLWPSGIPVLERQISQETDAAFKSMAPAHSKVYWIGTIGPHWRYGEKNDDGQDPMPLIDWHDATHDEASFADLQALVGLVASLNAYNAP